MEKKLPDLTRFQSLRLENSRGHDLYSKMKKRMLPAQLLNVLHTKFPPSKSCELSLFSPSAGLPKHHKWSLVSPVAERWNVEPVTQRPRRHVSFPAADSFRLQFPRSRRLEVKTCLRTNCGHTSGITQVSPAHITKVTWVHAVDIPLWAQNGLHLFFSFFFLLFFLFYFHAAPQRAGVKDYCVLPTRWSKLSKHLTLPLTERWVPRAGWLSPCSFHFSVMLILICK